MARKKRGKASETEKEEMKAKLEALLGDFGDQVDFDAPENFSKQQGDVSGFWVRCSPIQGFPRSAKLMDGRIDENKAAALILFEITKPCVISDDEGEYSIAEPGAMVGVWYKPGMRSLRWLADVEVWMKENPKEKWKDTGKGNEMITFEIRAPNRGKPIPVLEDTRFNTAPFVDGQGKTVGLHDLEPKQTAIQRVPI